jgi:hypothetical protein
MGFFTDDNSQWAIVRFAVVVLLIILLGVFIWGSRSNILLGAVFALSIILFLPYLADLAEGGLIGLIMAAKYGNAKWNDIKVLADGMKNWSQAQINEARENIRQRQAAARAIIGDWASLDPLARSKMTNRFKEDHKQSLAIQLNDPSAASDADVESSKVILNAVESIDG